MAKYNYHSYFQFPLCLLKGVFENAETGLNLIISYSIVNLAKKLSYSQNDVARQLMYDCYRNESKLHNSLRTIIAKYIKKGELTYDLDYNGFSGTGNEFEFEPSGEELRSIFAKDKEFYQLAILHYQIHCAAKVLNVQLGSIENTMRNYEKANSLVESHESKYGKDPTPGIKTSLLFDIRDKKNYEEMVLICGLIAIRSTVGKRRFTSTTKSVIAMRMIGAKSNVVLQDFLKDKKLKVVHERYSKRYPMDKLLDTLIQRKFLNSKIPIGRRIYISPTLNMDELEKVIITFRKEKNIKKKEKDARQRILDATRQ